MNVTQLIKFIFVYIFINGNIFTDNTIRGG